MRANYNIYETPKDKIREVPYTDKCIVLDLDQTLVATQDSLRSLEKLKILSDPKLANLRSRLYHVIAEDVEKRGYGSRFDFWGVKRPWTKEFLIFCFNYFEKVCVWSAGKRSYVDAIVEVLFKDLPYPDIVFAYENCVKDKSGYVTKPLVNIYDEMLTIDKSSNMTERNTFIIDDTETTFVNNVGNAVHIPAYRPNPTIKSISRDNRDLLKLMKWFKTEKVVESRDVRKLYKADIFD